MARGVKTGGRNIQKGQVLNPHGRPKLPADLQPIRQLSPGILKAMIDKLAELPLQQIIDLRDGGHLSMLEHSIVAVWIKAVVDGDHSRLNFILDRSRVGKVQDKLDITVGPKTVYRTTMTGDGRLLQDLLKPEIEEAEAELIGEAAN